MQHSETGPAVALQVVCLDCSSLSHVDMHYYESISRLQAYIYLKLVFCSVYYVGPNGWKKLSGDDVGELHYKYYPVVSDTVEQKMLEVAQ